MSAAASHRTPDALSASQLEADLELSSAQLRYVLKTASDDVNRRADQRMRAIARFAAGARALARIADTVESEFTPERLERVFTQPTCLRVWELVTGLGGLAEVANKRQVGVLLHDTDALLESETIRSVERFLTLLAQLPAMVAPYWQRYRAAYRDSVAASRSETHSAEDWSAVDADGLDADAD